MNSHKIFDGKDVKSYSAEAGKVLLLNPLIPSWVVTNVNGAILISLCDGKKTVDDIAQIIFQHTGQDRRQEIVKFFEYLDSKCLFNTSTDIPVHRPYRLNALYLNMTDECNLSCRYCYASTRVEKGQLLNYQDYVSIINFALEQNPNITVTFTGGEPLLSENTFPTAHYAKNKDLPTWLLTNGTLINDKNIDEIASLFDFVKISLDGSTPEMHEYFRGKDTFAVTMAAVEKLLNLGVNVQIAATITKYNMSDIIGMNKLYGSRLRYQPLFPAGSGAFNKELEITGREYYEVLCKTIGVNPFCDIENVINAHAANKSIMKCSLGDASLSISCTGDVYPCQLLHTEEFFLGNLKKQPLQAIYTSNVAKKWQNHTIFDIEGCKDCDIRLLCGGACQARHYYETGSISKSGEFCEYEKLGIINGILENNELVSM